MKYIPKHLANEIRKRCDFLSRHASPERALRAKNSEIKVLETMAQVNSYRIEHPTLRVPYYNPKNK